jgi:outer membrane lipoprotein-sorting protein
MKRTLIPAMLLFAFSASGALADTAFPNADKLISESRNRYDGKDVYTEVTLVLVDDRGKIRNRNMRYFQRDFGNDEQLTIYFTTPNDVKGVGFQSTTYDEKKNEPDAQWLYLPAFRQVRRIAAADKRGSFMGSEFSYIDMEKPRPSDYTQKVTGEANIIGRPCWVVERTPKNDEVIARTGYHKTIVWIDKESKVALKQNYFDAKGIQFKQMTVVKFEKIQDIWTIMHMDMHDRITKKHSSLVFRSVRYNIGLADKLFNQSILRTGISDADLPKIR